MKRKVYFQQALAAHGRFEKYGRKSKREQFLDEMNEVVPWSRLLSLVLPNRAVLQFMYPCQPLARRLFLEEKAT
jgi:hypothetical protein